MRNVFTPNIGTLFFALLFLFVSKNAYASHAMGADLSYECINPLTHTYKITVRFFRDCSGIDAPTDVVLDISSATCGQSFTANLPREACPSGVPGAACEVSPLCPSALAQSTCASTLNPYPGVQAFVYSANVIFPSACTDWTIAFTESSRNNAVTNLIGASGEDLYIRAVLNNTIPGGDNSPVFTTLPVPFICINQPFSYNHGAIDADGDSLVYTLVNALGNGGSAIGYNSPWSPTYPVTTSTGTFPFSSSTGQMTFTPTALEFDVVTVLVQEYRNGVFIGSTMRDIQMVILNLPGCSTATPTFSNVIQSTVANGFYIDPVTVQVCPGSTLSFSTLAIEPSNDSIFMESNIALSIPGAQYVTSYYSRDSVFGYFTWTPTALDTGQNTFIVVVKNKNCPLASNQAYAITIEVLAGTYAGPDISYCPAGGPVQLQAYGGTSFTWSPVTGLSNPNVGNPKASPPTTTTYVVTSNLSSSCNNRDTITVYRVPDFNYSLFQSDDTICRFEFVQLQVIPDPSFAPYTYSWTPSASLNSGTIANPVAQPDYTTTYIVAITSDTGCVIRDTTLRIVVEGQGPSVKITADKYSVCTGDTIQLTTDISTLPCGLNIIPCTGNFDLKTVGTGSVGGHSPYFGLYEDARMQMLFRASELQSLGMQRGTITDLAFDITTKFSSYPYSGFTIKMGCTSLNELTTFVPGLPVVLVDPGYVSTAGLNNHNLTTPYDWDGQSNLIIEICYDNSNWSSTDPVRATNTGFNSVVYSFQDGSSGCGLSVPTFEQIRPNVQFVYCIAPPKTITYTWNPTANLFTPDSLNPFVVLNQSTTYYLTANDGSCSGGGSVTLNIDTSFGITAGPDVPFCAGVPVQLQGAVTGIHPVGGTVNCGANNSTCTGIPVIKTYTPANVFSSTVTPFQGLFFSNQYEDQRTQILYRASDLLAGGFTKGTINQLGINISAKNSAFPWQNLNIKLGCTNKTQLNDTMWEPTTLVYTTPLIPFISVAGWNTFDLQNTFDWDGQTNIVLEICWDQPDGFPSSGADLISAGTVNYNSFHTGTAATAAGCNLPVPTFEIYQILPELRTRICAPPPLPVTYVWTPSGGLSDTTVAKPYASPEQETTYYLTAYFGGSCPKYDSVVVTPENFSYTLSDDLGICTGDTAQLSAAGGNTYTWQPSATLTCAECEATLAFPDNTTTYYVTITDTSTGCRANDSVTVNVGSVFATALFSDTTVDQGTQVTLAADVTGGNGIYTYQWSPVDYLDNPSVINPVSIPLTDVVYILSVTSNGCTDTTQINVNVNIIESPIAMPNAFTPNSDGKNDNFYPVILNNIATVKTFRVYNRYGEVVHDGVTPWDGKFKGVVQPAGTFVYYIVISRPAKADEKLQGSFALLH